MDIEKVKISINELLPWCFYGIYSFLILINSFSFIFTQKKYYISGKFNTNIRTLIYNVFL